MENFIFCAVYDWFEERLEFSIALLISTMPTGLILLLTQRRNLYIISPGHVLNLMPSPEW